MEPFDVMDAGRMAVFADPEGAAICVWQADQHKGARVVNEHGSLNFNGLDTRDAERAKAFYGAVFGWDGSTWPGGVRCGRCPATATTSRSRNPGLREQMAEMGAPEGSWTSSRPSCPIPDDEPDVPAHWSVTFAVDDADAAAARATELGGRSSCRRSTRRGCG